MATTYLDNKAAIIAHVDALLVTTPDLNIGDAAREYIKDNSISATTEDVDDLVSQIVRNKQEADDGTGDGRYWTLDNTNRALALGERIVSDTHGGSPILIHTLPAEFNYDAEQFNDIWVQNQDYLDNITVAVASGDQIYRKGVAQDVDASVILTPGQVAIFSIRTDSATWNLVILGDTAVGLHYEWLPPLLWWDGVSNGCAPLTQVEFVTDGPQYNVLDFDDTVKEYAFTTWKPPPSWDIDSLPNGNAGWLGFQVCWTANNTSSDQVRWGVKVFDAKDGTAMTGSGSGSVVLADNNQGTANELLVTGLGVSIVPATEEHGIILNIRLERTATSGADTMSGDARFLGMHLVWRSDDANDGEWDWF